jgi:hypothetical protein
MTLAKGTVEGDSFIIIRCPSCGKDSNINVAAPKDEIVLDKRKISVLELLKG